MVPRPSGATDHGRPRQPPVPVPGQDFEHRGVDLALRQAVDGGAHRPGGGRRHVGGPEHRGQPLAVQMSPAHVEPQQHLRLEAVLELAARDQHRVEEVDLLGHQVGHAGAVLVGQGLHAGHQFQEVAAVQGRLQEERVRVGAEGVGGLAHGQAQRLGRNEVGQGRRVVGLDEPGGVEHGLAGNLHEVRLDGGRGRLGGEPAPGP